MEVKCPPQPIKKLDDQPSTQPQSQSGQCWEEVLSLLGIKLTFLDCPADSLVTTPTEIPQLPYLSSYVSCIKHAKNKQIFIDTDEQQTEM
jgi:hypothetical protein